MRTLLLGFASALVALSSSLSASPVPVRVVDEGGGRYSLIRHGRPYQIRGGGGDTHLELARELGATTIRTWGIRQLEKEEAGRPLLDRCEAIGLTVMAGIWVQHERHGFDYDDPVQVHRQRESIRASVRKYKDHPALLLWGLGNEMENPATDGTDPRIWKELEVLAQIVRDEDPHHPVATVIAGAGGAKVRALAAHFPSLELLGVNSYATARDVAKELREAGWAKPFLLTEFGPPGHWEVPSTAWGAPIEPPGTAKADAYQNTHATILQDGAGRCLGTFAFIWGHKQETTSTWYGMFLPGGEKLPAVDAMSHAWTGRWPKNRSPQITRLDASFSHKAVAPETRVAVTVSAKDFEDDPLSYEWQIVEESSDRRIGGDAEATPRSVSDCLIESDGAHLQMRTPSNPGAYRVFCIVRDSKGGADAANFPFFVK